MGCIGPVVKTVGTRAAVALERQEIYKAREREEWRMIYRQACVRVKLGAKGSDAIDMHDS